MPQHDFLTNLPAPVKIWARDSFSHLFSENSLERIDKGIAEKIGISHYYGNIQYHPIYSNPHSCGSMQLT